VTTHVNASRLRTVWTQANELFLHNILQTDEDYFVREGVFSVHNIASGHGITFILPEDLGIKSS
jgi:hypothetical protein